MVLRHGSTASHHFRLSSKSWTRSTPIVVLRSSCHFGDHGTARRSRCWIFGMTGDKSVKFTKGRENGFSVT